MPWDDTPCDLEAFGTDGVRLGVNRTRRVSKTTLRKIWLRHYGTPFPEGMHFLHHCDEPRCANPEHIFAGTQRDNSRDAVAKGRMAGSIHGPGEKHRFARLTWDDVAEIRRRAKEGELHRVIAESYAVGQPAISRVVKGTRWKGGGSVAVGR